MTKDKAIELLDILNNHISVYDKAIHMAIDALKAEDVVEVVRCKDCKYDHKCSRNIIRPSKGGGVIYCPLEYCSEGERKDG